MTITPITPNSTDPVSATLDSLASARWTREPDWRTFQEKVMDARTRRFSFLRTRPALFTAIVILAIGGGAAAAVKMYDVFHVVGTATMDDGTTMRFEGTVITDDAAIQTDRTSSDGTAKKVVLKPTVVTKTEPSANPPKK